MDGTTITQLAKINDEQAAKLSLSRTKISELNNKVSSLEEKVEDLQAQLDRKKVDEVMTKARNALLEKQMKDTNDKAERDLEAHLEKITRLEESLIRANSKITFAAERFQHYMQEMGEDERVFTSEYAKERRFEAAKEDDEEDHSSGHMMETERDCPDVNVKVEADSEMLDQSLVDSEDEAGPLMLMGGAGFRRVTLKNVTKQEFFRRWASAVKKLDGSMTPEMLKTMEEKERFNYIRSALSRKTRKDTLERYLNRIQQTYMVRFSESAEHAKEEVNP